MISDICKKAVTDEEHKECLVYIQLKNESQNCQCKCHPGTIPATLTAGEMVHKAKNTVESAG